MRDNEFSLKGLISRNAVTLMFVVLCIVCFSFSGYTIPYLLSELVGRLSRNAFIVLALIIPIIAGMGINFAITIGAMAAQIAILWVLEWRIPGIQGFIVAALLTLPIATLFGYLVGKLLNQMKGQEMIGSMILGYFANGIYQLLFLFIFGNLVPMHAPNLVIKGATGIANTLDLKPTQLMYALDGVWRLNFSKADEFAIAIYVLAGLALVLAILNLIRKYGSKVKSILVMLVAIAACVALQLPQVKEWLGPWCANVFSLTSVPMGTFIIVALLCLFNNAIMRTKLGQNFRAVGQNGTVANASGINVNRTRLIAIIFSTVLAGWGQLIFVQNMGSLQTYGAHEQVGLYAGAAILVGGASIVRATNAQALLGCLLFHMLFIVAPPAGKNVFGDAAIGEYFRVFISYGVIALALVMHAWGSSQKKKPQNAIKDAGPKTA